MKIYQVHPLSTIFPQITGDAFNDLVADIKAFGLREAIVTLDGAILDGRNRVTACYAAGVEPRFEEWQPSREGDTPQAFVVSRNLHRRHLTDAQRALIAAQLVDHPNGRTADVRAGKKFTTGADAAKMMNVSTRSVRAARAVLKTGDEELIRKVQTGEARLRTVADPKPKKTHHHGDGQQLKADIIAFLDANEGRDERPIPKAERIELALRFVRMLGCGDAVVRKPDKPQPKPQRAATGGSTRRPLSALADALHPLPSGKPKPPPVDDEVAAFLANGGKIERCPSTVNPTPEESAALAAHHAEQEAIWAAKHPAGMR